MFNPHQNININISYNLGADKAGKQLAAKRINKQIKTQPSHPPNQCDIQIKLKNKNLQNNIKKSNQHKAAVDPKKAHRKKISNVPRNTCTPDLFNDRRIKTEGPSADHEFTSAFKKQGRAKLHFKSMQQPPNKLTQSTKKPNSLAKMTKSLKAGHITSCTIPNLKKLSPELGEHVISQGSTSLPKKRRTQSALLRNDKVISKLLSMSILASQLGGSQPITSERRSNQSGPSKTLKEYMSSMDMRIIRCMQDDVPVFMDHNLHSPQDTIRTIMRTKQLSLEELTRKAIVIQRFWKKCKRRVVRQYHLLFRQIADKLNKQDKISQISGIAHSPADINQDEHNVSSLFQNQGLVSSIKRDAEILRQNSIESDSFDSSIHNIRWIEENEEPSGSVVDRLGGLNIKKYRELVSEEVKNNSTKSKHKEKYKQQVDQWNSINKHITSIMNNKGPIDSQILLDELIRQSKHNQYWIDHDHDFDHSEHRPPVPPRQRDPFIQDDHFLVSREREGPDYQRGVDTGILSRDMYLQQPVMPINNFSQISQHSEDLINLPPLSIPQKSKQKQKYQDSMDDQEQQDLYDKNKYELMSDDRVKQQQKQPSKSLVYLQPKAKSGVLKIQIELQKSVQPNKQPEQVWISQQIMQDNVVRNYLDCGLDDFGININSRIMQLPKMGKEDGSEDNQNQNQYNVSSDEAIGNKFQQANLALLKNNRHDEPDPEPHSHHLKLNSVDTDGMVEEIVKFLISEFASDISVILKKSAGPVSEKKPAAPKGQGIPTNFNSIRDYLKKFINFICREESNLQKIVETINKDIGPSSLEILTYLRPEAEDIVPYAMENDQQSFDDEQGLFVIPAEIFEQFQCQLEQEYRAENQKEMSQRMKAYLSFWHRCIFESYNQCLDYERPYGIEGKPYQWTTENKVFRRVVRSKVMQSFEKAENRLLDLTMLVGGIIFQKNDSPFSGADLSDEQKHMMNEERLSRILATELLESEQSWINYNDQMAQLLVQLSRMIEQKIFFEHGTELKKLQRRRKIIAEETATEDSVVFNLEEL